MQNALCNAAMNQRHNKIFLYIHNMRCVHNTAKITRDKTERLIDIDTDLSVRGNIKITIYCRSLHIVYIFINTIKKCRKFTSNFLDNKPTHEVCNA